VTKVDYLLLSHDEFSILSDHLNLTYIYNPLSADPTLARHVLHKLQRWALKMSVLSYRMEHVMSELNYWTDLMTRWGVRWVAGSEDKAHGKMASLFSQPDISPPDYDTVEFPSNKEILLAQQSAVNEYERCQQGSEMARQEVPPQQVDDGGMRMIKNAYEFPSVQSSCSYACVCRSTAALKGTERTKRRLAQSRSMWRGQRWPRMSRFLCRTFCTVSRLFLESKCRAG
jgi:hypothetical protein